MYEYNERFWTVGWTCWCSAYEVMSHGAVWSGTECMSCGCNFTHTHTHTYSSMGIQRSRLSARLLRNREDRLEEQNQEAFRLLSFLCALGLVLQLRDFPLQKHLRLHYLVRSCLVSFIGRSFTIRSVWLEALFIEDIGFQSIMLPSKCLCLKTLYCKTCLMEKVKNLINFLSAMSAAINGLAGLRKRHSIRFHFWHPPQIICWKQMS